MTIFTTVFQSCKIIKYTASGHLGLLNSEHILRQLVFLYFVPHQLLFADFPSQRTQIDKAWVVIALTSKNLESRLFYISRSNSATVFPEGTAPQFKI